jgi:hypothetical protein
MRKQRGNQHATTRLFLSRLLFSVTGLTAANPAVRAVSGFEPSRGCAPTRRRSDRSHLSAGGRQEPRSVPSDVKRPPRTTNHECLFSRHQHRNTARAMYRTKILPKHYGGVKRAEGRRRCLNCCTLLPHNLSKRQSNKANLQHPLQHHHHYPHGRQTNKAKRQHQTQHPHQHHDGSHF